MDYIESNLSSDEKIMAKIKHSWAGLISAMLGFVLILAAGIITFYIKPICISIIGEATYKAEPMPMPLLVFIYILGAFLIFTALVYLLTKIFEIKYAQLVVTNKRVFGRRGFISKRTTDVLLSKIDTINVSNGFFGALFHYGTIEIVSAASGRLSRAERASLMYSFISNTSEFRKVVLETIDKVKKEEREAQAKSISEAVNSSN